MALEPLVLAVDDEIGILRLVKLELSVEGFRVIVAHDGEEALHLAEHQRPDLVILDIVMPHMSGLEVMRRLRERTDIPIILLTANGHDADRVNGLDLGADDYLVKPFNPVELIARVKAVLRRAGPAISLGNNIVQSGEVEIDLHRRSVKMSGAPLHVSRTEWLVLQQLSANAGKVMLTAELLNLVWGPEYVDDVQYLRVWISRLRNKIERDAAHPKIIKTVRGMGYCFDLGRTAQQI